MTQRKDRYSAPVPHGHHAGLWNLLMSVFAGLQNVDSVRATCGEGRPTVLTVTLNEGNLFGFGYDFVPGVHKDEVAELRFRSDRDGGSHVWAKLRPRKRRKSHTSH